eukprot:scaffold32563_cov24-Prasinocladus_malaysianus.AAC.2
MSYLVSPPLSNQRTGLNWAGLESNVSRWTFLVDWQGPKLERDGIRYYELQWRKTEWDEFKFKETIIERRRNRTDALKL